jgi:hypothetical protein
MEKQLTFYDFWKEGYTREQVRKMYENDLKKKIMYGGYYNIKEIVEVENITSHSIMNITRHSIMRMGITTGLIKAWHQPMVDHIVKENQPCTKEEIVKILNTHCKTRQGKEWSIQILSSLPYSFVRKEHKPQKDKREFYDEIHTWYRLAIEEGYNSHERITVFFNSNYVKTSQGLEWKRSNIAMFVKTHPEYDWSIPKVKIKEMRAKAKEIIRDKIKSKEVDLKDFSTKSEFEKYAYNKWDLNVPYSVVGKLMRDLGISIALDESHAWVEWYNSVEVEIKRYYNLYGWLPIVQILELFTRNEFPNRNGTKWYPQSMYRLINNYGLDLSYLYIQVILQNMDLEKSLSENVEHLNRQGLNPLTQRGAKGLWSESRLQEFVVWQIEETGGLPITAKREDSNN